jgi:hypothetical protein
MATAYTTEQTGTVVHTGDTDYAIPWNTAETRKETLLTAGVVNVMGFKDLAGTWRGAGGVGGAGDDAIIVLAIAKAKVAGKTIYFPQGTYQITTTIPVNGFDVVCSPKAVFTPAAKTTNIVSMQINGSWVGGIFNVEDFEDYSGVVIGVDGSYIPALGQTTLVPYVKDLYIYGQNHTSNRGVAVKLYVPGTAGEFISYCLFDNIRVYRMYRGIYLYLDDTDASGAWLNGNLFSNISIGSTTLPIELYAKAGTDGVNGNLFNNIMIQPTAAAPGPTVDILKITNGSFNQFNNTYMWDFQNLSGYAINFVSGQKNQYKTPLFPGSDYDNVAEFISDTGSDNFIAGFSNSNTKSMSLGTNYHYDWAPNGYSAGVTPAAMAADTKYVSDALVMADAALGDFILLGTPRLQDATAHMLAMAQAHVTTAGYIKIVCSNKNGVTAITPLSDDWYAMRIPNRRRTMQYSHAPGEIAAATQVAQDITVTGATLQDFIIATPDKDITDFMWSITITASNTATLVLHNFKASAVDPGTILWSLKLIKSDKANVVMPAVVRTETLPTLTGHMTTLTAAYTADVRIGDFYLITPGIDITDLMLWPYCSSTGTMRVYCYNGTSGEVAFIDCPFRACWMKDDDGFMFL